MTDTIGYSLEDLRNDGYPLLADFLFEAPNTHRYVRYFKEATNPPEDFLNQMQTKGDFAQGLLHNSIGEAATHADPTNAAILYAVINASTRYAIVDSDKHSDAFTKHTVPSEWVQETDTIDA